MDDNHEIRGGKGQWDGGAVGLLPHPADADAEAGRHGLTACLPEANPPMLIGGLRQGAITELIGAKVDQFSVTMSSQVAEKHLLTITSEHEAGYAKQGFKRTERRECLGGVCWRRWEPVSESSSWGLAYESWEWDGGKGGGSDAAAEKLRGVDVRPSRVDVAFDFSCDETVTAETIACNDQVQQHCRRIGVTADGVSGSGGIFTRYIGSASSPLMIRVYRKDLQNAILGEMFGPMIRIELVMRDHYARAWWAVWNHSKQEAYRWAAAQVERLSSLHVIAGDLPVPEIVHPETKAAEPLLALIDQYGSILVACREAGIDLDALASAKVEAMSRAGKYRHAKRVKELQKQDPAEVAAMVLAVIHRK